MNDFDKNKPLSGLYGTHTTPFGDYLLVVDQGRVCYASFVDNNLDALLADVAQRMPQVSLFRDDELTKPLVERIFNNALDLSAIQLSGTDFQKKVLSAVCSIPLGQTISYSELAQKIGNPKAARAVGSALAKNTLAYILPCHRVITKSKDVHKYRWGSSRKQALLSWELLQKSI